MTLVVALLIILVLIAAFNAHADNPVANIIQALVAVAVLVVVAAVALAFAALLALFLYWALATEGQPKWLGGIAIVISMWLGICAFSILDGFLERRAERRRQEALKMPGVASFRRGRRLPTWMR